MRVQEPRFSLGDIEPDWVRSVRGVRQGCPMSPQLFGLYTEELAERLRRTGKGININGNCLNLLMYADDIVILSESKEDLQSLLDVIAGFGRDFDVKFTDEKSQVLVINGDDSDVGRTWKLGEMTLKRTKKYPELGLF